MYEPLVITRLLTRFQCQPGLDPMRAVDAAGALLPPTFTVWLGRATDCCSLTGLI